MIGVKRKERDRGERKGIGDSVKEMSEMKTKRKKGR
jgi:hypothetical protein